MESNRIKKVSFEEFALVLLTFKSIYSLSNVIYYPLVDTLLLSMALILIAFIVIRRKYTYKQLIAFGVIGLIMVASSFRAGMWYMMITYVAILLMAKMDFNKSIHIILKVQFIYILFHFFLSVIFLAIGVPGVIVNYDGEMRAACLLTHPNVLAMLCISMVFEWTWLHWNNIKNREYIAMLIIMCTVFFLTKTDAMLIMIVLELCLTTKSKVLKRISKVISMFGIPVATFFCWILGYLYLNAGGTIGLVIKYIDIFVSRRIAILAMQLSMNDIGLLGNGMNTVSGYNFDFGIFGVTAIDNVYFTIVFYYGLIFVFLLSLLFYKLAKFDSRKVNFFLTAFVLYGLVEGQIIISLIFPSLLLLVLLIKNKKEVSSIISE